MRIGIVLLLTGIAVAAPGVVKYGAEFLAVDKCLDGGGSFDYTRMQCDQIRAHPYVAFSTRHLGLVRSVAGGAVLAVVGAAVLWIARARSRQAR